MLTYQRWPRSRTYKACPCLLLQHVGLIILILSPFLAQATEPFIVPTSDSTYGPDGPWQAVKVQIGESKVDLYPGSLWETVVLGQTFCDGTTGGACPAKNNLYSTKTSFSMNKAFDRYNEAFSNNVNQGETLVAKRLFEMFWMVEPTGSGVEVRYTNVTMKVAKSGNTKFPGGLEIKPTLGYFSLGAPDENQIFTVDNEPDFVGKIVLNAMFKDDRIPSRSWGMHIGSATLNQKLSLVFGGYDSSRLVSDAFAYDSKGKLQVKLMDVAMGVAEGKPPIDDLKLGGKLGSNGNFNLMIDPQVPYMYLPSAVCQSMVQGLPVNYDDELGLYIWDAKDSSYETIVNSPLYLDFQFEAMGTSNNSIKLPMKLFDLMLESPIKAQNTPYFPCRHTVDKSKYTLGRAFLQGAFIGMNWDEGKFWMGQAPGPSSGSSVITTIQKSDTTISKAEFSWKSSWASTWKATKDTSSIEPDENALPSSTPAPSDSSLVTNTPVPVSGLSTGAMAGIGVGATLGALLMLSGALYFVRRRREKRYVKNNDALTQVHDFGTAYPPPRFLPYRPPIYEVEGTPYDPPKTPLVETA
jgi:LPXTG-motif cell wall-anchored protein